MCTGHFATDFSELCQRNSMVIIPPVVLRPKRPPSPEPQKPPDSKEPKGKGKDAKDKNPPPPDPEPEQELDENGGKGFQGLAFTYHTDLKYGNTKRRFVSLHHLIYLLSYMNETFEISSWTQNIKKILQNATRRLFAKYMVFHMFHMFGSQNDSWLGKSVVVVSF